MLFLGAVVWQLNHWWTPNQLVPYRKPGEIRESWTMVPVKATPEAAAKVTTKPAEESRPSAEPLAAKLEVSKQEVEGSVAQ